MLDALQKRLKQMIKHLRGSVQESADRQGNDYFLVKISEEEHIREMYREAFRGNSGNYQRHIEKALLRREIGNMRVKLRY